MVGRVRVRGQGPVRRGQTTTTFKKGGRVKLMSGGNPHRRTQKEKQEDMWKKVYGKRPMRKKTRQDKPMAKGGRVKKQLGGAMPGVGAAGAQRPLAAGAQPLAAGVQRPLAAGAARPLAAGAAGVPGVQRPVGGGVRPGARMAKKGGSIKKAKGGRVKKARGGTAFKKVGTKFRTLVEDWKDSGKKLNVHQDPRSKMAAELRYMRDNPPKKKSKSPHTEPKKRKTYDTSKLPGYVKPKPRRPSSGRLGPRVATRRTRPTPRNK